MAQAERAIGVGGRELTRECRCTLVLRKRSMAVSRPLIDGPHYVNPRLAETDVQAVAHAADITARGTSVGSHMGSGPWRTGDLR